MKRSTHLLLLALFCGESFAQQLQRGEYYIDTDPGFGSATAIAITPGNLVDLVENVDISTAPPGVHTLGLRMKDDAGHWGLTGHHTFVLRTSVNGDIVAMEWFVDIDPGFGAAQPIAIGAPASVLLDQQFQVDAALLAGGPHHVLVRSFNSFGTTSLTYPIPFDMLVGIDALSTHGITAGPNPMHETLTLQRQENTDSDLTLFDANGRAVYKGPWTGTRHVVDTSTLSAGCYHLMLLGQNNTPILLKLVKQ